MRWQYAFEKSLRVFVSLVCSDVKLENVFLTKECEIMLGDFGLTMSTKQEMAISPVGTVEYMAPEVCTCPALVHAASGHDQMYTARLHEWICTCPAW